MRGAGAGVERFHGGSVSGVGVGFEVAMGAALGEGAGAGLCTSVGAAVRMVTGSGSPPRLALVGSAFAARGYQLPSGIGFNDAVSGAFFGPSKTSHSVPGPQFSYIQRASSTSSLTHPCEAFFPRFR